MPLEITDTLQIFEMLFVHIWICYHNITVPYLFYLYTSRKISILSVSFIGFTEFLYHERRVRIPNTKYNIKINILMALGIAVRY